MKLEMPNLYMPPELQKIHCYWCDRRFFWYLKDVDVVVCGARHPNCGFCSLPSGHGGKHQCEECGQSF
jgi:hypothetical protein